MVCCLFFLLATTFELSAMESRCYSHVPSLKILAAQRVYELGLAKNIFQQNLLDDVFFDECRNMPNRSIENHKKALLARIERDNGVAHPYNRVQERIYTYNAIGFINRKINA